MRAAIVKDGVVVNVAVATDEWTRITGAIPCGDVGPGWLYVDGEFLPPPATPHVIIMPPVQAQLDALFEGGAALAAMKQQLAEVRRQQGEAHGAPQ